MSPYDIPVDDPKLLAAVAYLQGLGAPQPTVVRQIASFPGGSYAFTTATFAQTEIIAALMILAPNVTANELGEKGVMPVHPGLSPVAPIPTVSGPLVPTPKPIAASPIGPRQESTPPAVGDEYYLSSGWHFAAGTTWQENEMTFLLHETPSPFGLSGVYWERTK